MRSTVKEFREFVVRGNVVDLAIGVAIGAAFGSVVSSVTEGIISPLIARIPAIEANDDYGVLDFKWRLLIEAATKFLITAFVLFVFVVKPMNHVRRLFPGEPIEKAKTKVCGECRSTVPFDATRCAFCTQPLPATAT